MRILNRILFIVLCGSLFFLHASAQDFPAKPNKLVTDFTKTLSDRELQQLESKLVAFDDSTSTQIAVVIMTSTGDYDISDYGVRLAKKWGIGGKENDNGILLLVALGDRAVTIQTGYGVEGAVPDVIAHRIIDEEIKPAFQRGEYYAGLNKATDALIRYTKGEYKAPKQNPAGGRGSFLLIVIIIVILIAVFSRRGGGGRNGGQIVGRGGASDLLWWGMLSGLGRGGRGGGFGGGGFGGGGGGFGGFGGGGFGGGGASGRW